MADNIYYIYEDQNKKPLYRQVRYYKDGNKNFYSERFENGKWQKGLKNVEHVLYRLPQIIEAIKKAEKIYFVEGEKDVETLIKKGKIATTIAGGANQKWQDSYTKTLEGSDIIIIPDNDKPGQEFATRVADSLVGHANTIKIIDLKNKWPDLKEKGDITDIFEQVSNDSEVLEKIKELENETKIYVKNAKKLTPQDIQPKEITIEELDLKLKIPKGYVLSKEQGITKHTKNDKIFKNTLISPIPIVISKILKNTVTGEESVELAYYKRNKLETLIVNKNVLYNSQSIITLANKGIPITSNGARAFISYLYDLEVANYNDLKIEHTINRMGWVNCNTFIPFKNNDIHLNLEPGISTWLDKINKKKGTFEKWKSNIQEFLDEDESGLIRFTLDVGFSSCLLHIVEMRGTIYNLYGPSGIGKTGLLELVNSIYAPPDNIITFAATPISITILSERLSGIGLIIDEKQSSMHDNQISTLLYTLAEGRTRMKATKESDLIENKRFEINVITSAEEKLNESGHTGASRRTIELYTNKIFSNDKMSRKAHKVSRQNYGFAGEIFINQLIDKYSFNNYEPIVKKYEEIVERLSNEVEGNVVNSYVQSIAVIVLSDILINEIIDFGFLEDESLELGIRILNQIENESEIDEVERAKEILEDWIILNDSRFDRQKFLKDYINIDNCNIVEEKIENENNVYEKFGMYQEGIYYIIPLKFNELMRKNNFSPNKIRRGFAERGYIKIDEINNRFSVTKFYNGGNRRMIAYKLENESIIIETKLNDSVKVEENPFKPAPGGKISIDDIFKNEMSSNEIDEFQQIFNEWEEKNNE